MQQFEYQLFIVSPCPHSTKLPNSICYQNNTNNFIFFRWQTIFLRWSSTFYRLPSAPFWILRIVLASSVTNKFHMGIRDMLKWRNKTIKVWVKLNKLICCVSDLLCVTRPCKKSNQGILRIKCFQEWQFQ